MLDAGHLKEHGAECSPPRQASSPSRVLHTRVMPGRRPRAKTAYHHGNLREELVSAALELIRATGAEGLTLRAVAKRLGVSQAAPYRHFPTKDALLAAVAVDGFETLQREIERLSRRAGPNVLARFQAVGLAYATFALKYPAHFKVMYGPHPEEFRSGPVAEAGRKAFVFYRETISACIAAGQSRNSDVNRIAFAAWAYVHGLIALYNGGQLPPSLTPARLRKMVRDMDVFLAQPLDHV